jgi:hypothetical protein
MISDAPDTLLDHPALAGQTVYLRRGPRWETFVVRAGGGLTPAPRPADPVPTSWRHSVGA